ncbi:unnamed protein product [Closterium sp. Yama58-4]|nr:unnamed protein product [Closterium sp. Yama58-4]
MVALVVTSRILMHDSNMLIRATITSPRHILIPPFSSPSLPRSAGRYLHSLHVALGIYLSLPVELLIFPLPVRSSFRFPLPFPSKIRFPFPFPSSSRFPLPFPTRFRYFPSPSLHAISPPVTVAFTVSPPLPGALAISPPRLVELAFSPPLPVARYFPSPSRRARVFTSPSRRALAISPPLTVTLAISPPVTVALAISPPLLGALAISPPFPAELAFSPPLPAVLLLFCLPFPPRSRYFPSPSRRACVFPSPSSRALAILPPLPAALSLFPLPFPSSLLALAVSPPVPVALAISPPLPGALAISPPLPVELAFSPPLPVELSLFCLPFPPRYRYFASPSRRACVFPSPSSRALAILPPLPVALAVSPPVPVALAISPPLPGALAISPPLPVELAFSPPLPVELSISPSLPIALAISPPLPVAFSWSQLSAVLTNELHSSHDVRVSCTGGFFPSRRTRLLLSSPRFPRYRISRPGPSSSFIITFRRAASLSLFPFVAFTLSHHVSLDTLHLSAILITIPAHAGIEIDPLLSPPTNPSPILRSLCPIGFSQRSRDRLREGTRPHLDGDGDASFTIANIVQRSYMQRPTTGGGGGGGGHRTSAGTNRPATSGGGRESTVRGRASTGAPRNNHGRNCPSPLDVNDDGGHSFPSPRSRPADTFSTARRHHSPFDSHRGGGRVARSGASGCLDRYLGEDMAEASLEGPQKQRYPGKGMAEMAEEWPPRSSVRRSMRRAGSMEVSALMLRASDFDPPTSRGLAASYGTRAGKGRAEHGEHGDARNNASSRIEGGARQGWRSERADGAGRARASREGGEEMREGRTGRRSHASAATVDIYRAEEEGEDEEEAGDTSCDMSPYATGDTFGEMSLYSTGDTSSYRSSRQSRSSQESDEADSAAWGGWGAPWAEGGGSEREKPRVAEPRFAETAGAGGRARRMRRAVSSVGGGSFGSRGMGREEAAFHALWVQGGATRRESERRLSGGSERGAGRGAKGVAEGEEEEEAEGEEDGAGYAREDEREGRGGESALLGLRSPQGQVLPGMVLCPASLALPATPAAESPGGKATASPQQQQQQQQSLAFDSSQQAQVWGRGTGEGEGSRGGGLGEERGKGGRSLEEEGRNGMQRGEEWLAGMHGMMLPGRGMGRGRLSRGLSMSACALRRLQEDGSPSSPDASAAGGSFAELLGGSRAEKGLGRGRLRSSGGSGMWAEWHSSSSSSSRGPGGFLGGGLLIGKAVGQSRPATAAARVLRSPTGGGSSSSGGGGGGGVVSFENSQKGVGREQEGEERRKGGLVRAVEGSGKQPRSPSPLFASPLSASPLSASPLSASPLSSSSPFRKTARSSRMEQQRAEARVGGGGGGGHCEAPARTGVAAWADAVDAGGKWPGGGDARRRDEADSYWLDRSELGRGRFGIIRLCLCRRTGGRFACKTISKELLTCQQDVEDVRREVAVMALMHGHPHVAALIDTFEDEQHVHLVMELCAGGELFDRIKAKGRYSEPQAAVVVATVARVLQQCHAAGVIHRDVKPENILLCTKQSDTDVKLIDFGVATFFHPGVPCTDMAGSPYYLAPEVLAESYGPEADVWSTGVVLYILLSGLPPFWAPTNEAIFQAIKAAPVNLVRAPWPSVSGEVRDLVRRMLEKRPEDRITLAEVLEHPWIVRHTCPPAAPREGSL